MILLTLGDPNGLGPELVCRLSAAGTLPDDICIIGPESALLHHCDQLGIAPFWARINTPGEVRSGVGVQLFIPEGLGSFSPTPGKPSVAGGRAAGLILDQACRWLADQSSGSLGTMSLVTGPLNKAMLQEAGFDFPGHTEFLAERSGVGRNGICMHLQGPKLRVSLVTTHPPLRHVPEAISEERVLRCIKLTCEFMAQLGEHAPVAVCGLNPHAGEGGKIGREEIETIIPAIMQAQTMGLPVQGPFPADTVFRHAVEGRFSAVLAMYHDQGLAPLKLLHFGEAVNVTLGLPYVRTSVDHGTGYDIVGTGIASTGSMQAALDLALQLTENRK
ncbi:MAG: 4-hydroxythreonine-4-phosphate dehydrogenase PdxA [Desulfovibrionales bacterium]